MSGVYVNDYEESHADPDDVGEISYIVTVQFPVEALSAEAAVNKVRPHVLGHIHITAAKRHYTEAALKRPTPISDSRSSGCPPPESSQG